PVAASRFWKTAEGQPDAFADVLKSLRARWLAAAAAEPRLPGDGGPLQTLVDVLTRQPTSVRWLGRSAAAVGVALPRCLAGRGIQLPVQAQLAALRQDIVAELTALGFPIAASQQIQPLINDTRRTTSNCRSRAGPTSRRSTQVSCRRRT